MDVDEVAVGDRSDERCLDAGELNEDMEEEDVDENGSEDSKRQSQRLAPIWRSG